MLRNSILYRRFWYVRRRHTRNLRIYIRLAVVLLVACTLVASVREMLLPRVQTLSERKVREMVMSVVEETVGEILAEGSSSQDWVSLGKDRNGRVSAIELDTGRLNRLTSAIKDTLHQRLEFIRPQAISIPLGAALGEWVGQLGTVKEIHLGNCEFLEVNYATSYTDNKDGSAGQQVRLEVRMEVPYSGPWVSGSTLIYYSAPLAETLVTGAG